mmetsp:Transcript_10335/g.15580  ORF Transcript_10335/g.15580 Transcript_10335/m.15580 type:complete len:117 (-) Transcript_10335:134-484(-)
MDFKKFSMIAKSCGLTSTLVSSYFTYKGLSGASVQQIVPMHWGITGSVDYSINNRYALLMFPALTSIGLFFSFFSSRKLFKRKQTSQFFHFIFNLFDLLFFGVSLVQSNEDSHIQQ